MKLSDIKIKDLTDIDPSITMTDIERFREFNHIGSRATYMDEWDSFRKVKDAIDKFKEQHNGRDQSQSEE